MEQTELLDLIPLYVTNKVSKEQKAAIENALAASSELRGELGFWRSALATTKHAAVNAAGNHLSSELVVDYARGEVSDRMRQLEIQKHLQACASCREDYEIMKAAFDMRGVAKEPEHMVNRFTRVLRATAKPAYSIPALAVFILGILLLRDRLIGPSDFTMSFVLHYQSQERSFESGSLPALSLGSHVSVVRLSVPVPHTTLQPVQYLLTLVTPGAEHVPLLEGLSWTLGTPFDTASVSVPVSELQERGAYTLLATLEYPQTSRAFEYTYRFKVVFEE
jgi:hypothetical protein